MVRPKMPENAPARANEGGTVAATTVAAGAAAAPSTACIPALHAHRPPAISVSPPSAAAYAAAPAGPSSPFLDLEVARITATSEAVHVHAAWAQPTAAAPGADASRATSARPTPQTTQPPPAEAMSQLAAHIRSTDADLAAHALSRVAALLAPALASGGARQRVRG